MLMFQHIFYSQYKWFDQLLKRIKNDLLYRPLGYERVYLPLYKVADTPFHIQGDDIVVISGERITQVNQSPTLAPHVIHLYL